MGNTLYFPGLIFNEKIFRMINSRSLICLCLLLLWSAAAWAQHSLVVKVSVSEEVKEKVQPGGRLFLFLSDQNRPEPRQQLWPSHQNSIFAANMDALPTGTETYISESKHQASYSDFGLGEVPAGTYYVQALWQQSEQETGPDAPGNLYSTAKEVKIQGDMEVQVEIDQVIPPRQLAEHELVKLVEIKSEALSAFWEGEMKVRASVLLPSNFYKNPNATYPICYNIAGYGGRYTRINRYIERDTAFLDWWMTDEAPQVITVFLDGDGPFGDPYQLDSENSGPYGQALTEELIPYIEKKYRAIGTPETRFLDGCSTGGWVSLALQLYYPDLFGGTYSYSPDPVHFGQMQLIDLYEDKNAFQTPSGLVRPSMRSTLGDPIFSIQQEIGVENVVGRSNTFVNSGEQWGAWNALYSPRDEETGLPRPVFHPVTGEIYPDVVEHWKKYDLLEHVKNNWNEIGPKLQGKIYVWMGDMDQFYLNNALRSFDDYLSKTEAPQSDSVIEFTPQKGHCTNYSHKEVLEKIQERLQKEGLVKSNYPLEEDIRTLDGIIKAYYEVVSGPEGPKQIERDKSLHHPDAHVMIAGEDKDGKPYLQSMDLDTYHQKVASNAAFYEREIYRKTETFGHITQVWSTYEYTFEPGGPVKGRGVNSIQLYHDGDRWWILGWMYDSERKNNTLPAKYLPKKK